MKDVLLDIKGTQSTDGDSDVIELTTLGSLAFKNGKYYVIYSENDKDTGLTVKTTLKAEGDDKVTLIRSGAVDSRLIIEKGQRSKCFYSAGVGQLVLGVFGEEIVNRLDESGGRLSMTYTIDVENNLLSTNKVEINIREI